MVEKNKKIILDAVIPFGAAIRSLRKGDKVMAGAEAIVEERVYH